MARVWTEVLGRNTGSFRQRMFEKELSKKDIDECRERKHWTGRCMSMVC